MKRNQRFLRHVVSVHGNKSCSLNILVIVHYDSPFHIQSKFNTTGAASGARTAYLTGSPEFNPEVVLLNL